MREERERGGERVREKDKKSARIKNKNNNALGENTHFENKKNKKIERNTDPPMVSLLYWNRFKSDIHIINVVFVCLCV